MRLNIPLTHEHAAAVPQPSHRAYALVEAKIKTDKVDSKCVLLSSEKGAGQSSKKNQG